MQFLFNPKPPRHVSVDPFMHTIVLLGDDLALGVGDKINFNTGISKRLLKRIKESSILRHRWTITNLGVANSTSKDWADQKWLQKIQPFKCEHKRHSAIICVGSNDKNDDTVFNLKLIIQELMEVFGAVFLVTIPDWQTNKNEANLNLPQDLIGAFVDRSNIEFRQSKLYWRKYFSSLGYDLLSKDLFLRIENDLRKLEFNEEKYKLS